jgi:hypothetical protein
MLSFDHFLLPKAEPPSIWNPTGTSLDLQSPHAYPHQTFYWSYLPSRALFPLIEVISRGGPLLHASGKPLFHIESISGIPLL